MFTCPKAFNHKITFCLVKLVRPGESWLWGRMRPVGHLDWYKLVLWRVGMGAPQQGAVSCDRSVYKTGSSMCSVCRWPPTSDLLPQRVCVCEAESPFTTGSWCFLTHSWSTRFHVCKSIIVWFWTVCQTKWTVWRWNFKLREKIFSDIFVINWR